MTNNFGIKSFISYYNFFIFPPVCLHVMNANLNELSHHFLQDFFCAIEKFHLKLKLQFFLGRNLCCVFISEFAVLKPSIFSEVGSVVCLRFTNYSYLRLILELAKFETHLIKKLKNNTFYEAL